MVFRCQFSSDTLNEFRRGVHYLTQIRFVFVPLVLAQSSRQKHLSIAQVTSIDCILAEC